MDTTPKNREFLLVARTEDAKIVRVAVSDVITPENVQSIASSVSVKFTALMYQHRAPDFNLFRGRAQNINELLSEASMQHLHGFESVDEEDMSVTDLY